MFFYLNFTTKYSHDFTDSILHLQYVWVMPSSSARCAQLPRALDKVPFYSALRKFRDYLNGTVDHISEEEMTFAHVKLKNFKKEDKSIVEEDKIVLEEDKITIEEEEEEEEDSNDTEPRVTEGAEPQQEAPPAYYEAPEQL